MKTGDIVRHISRYDHEPIGDMHRVVDVIKRPSTSCVVLYPPHPQTLETIAILDDGTEADIHDLVIVAHPKPGA